MDELGGGRVTEWSFEAIESILNGIYNRGSMAIFTTNLANLAAGASAQQMSVVGARREDTLGDRIGTRMHSRLQQMCRVVEVRGEDYRMRSRTRRGIA